MIWDKLSPFYDFFENIYNKKCYRGIAEKIKDSLASYKEFISSHNISCVEYSVVEGRMPCAFAIITNC